jgi:hypothetical protein
MLLWFRGEGVVSCALGLASPVGCVPPLWPGEPRKLPGEEMGPGERFS